MELGKQEEWRLVPETDGLLYVSNTGKVWSDSFQITGKNGVTQTFKPVMKKLTLGNNGYFHFRFKGKLYLLHRCVALAFLHRSNDDLNVVNHKDGNKLNNDPCNLEWGTHKSNQIHAVETGLRDYSKINNPKGCDVYNSKLKDSDVFKIIKELERGEFSQKELGKTFGVSQTVISNIKLKKSWSHLNKEVS